MFLRLSIYFVLLSFLAHSNTQIARQIHDDYIRSEQIQQKAESRLTGIFNSLRRVFSLCHISSESVLFLSRPNFQQELLGDPVLEQSNLEKKKESERQRLRELEKRESEGTLSNKKREEYLRLQALAQYDEEDQVKESKQRPVSHKQERHFQVPGIKTAGCVQSKTDVKESSSRQNAKDFIESVKSVNSVNTESQISLADFLMDPIKARRSLENGLKPNLKVSIADRGINITLIQAAVVCSCDREIVELLLQSKACHNHLFPPGDKDFACLTLKEIAEKINRPDLADLLEEYGARE